MLTGDIETMKALYVPDEELQIRFHEVEPDKRPTDLRLWQTIHIGELIVFVGFTTDHEGEELLYSRATKQVNGRWYLTQEFDGPLRSLMFSVALSVRVGGPLPAEAGVLERGAPRERMSELLDAPAPAGRLRVVETFGESGSGVMMDYAGVPLATEVPLAETPEQLGEVGERLVELFDLLRAHNVDGLLAMLAQNDQVQCRRDEFQPLRTAVANRLELAGPMPGISEVEVLVKEVAHLDIYTVVLLSYRDGERKSRTDYVVFKREEGELRLTADISNRAGVQYLMRKNLNFQCPKALPTVLWQ